MLNTGSTSTKIGLFEAGKLLFEQNISHPNSELQKYESVMDQDQMRLEAITGFLSSKEVALESIDLVMSRGGMITPIEPGVYLVTEEMKAALREGKSGVHASNVCAIVADKLKDMVNAKRGELGLPEVKAYIADAPFSDEMIDEARVGGHPLFPRKPIFHALNSRAVTRFYAREKGLDYSDVTVIVAHMGGGTSVSLHHKGRIVDTNNALGGDGPVSPDRTGTVYGSDLIEVCYSGQYTKDEVKKMLVGKGGVVAHFGTNNFKDVTDRAEAGDPECELFVTAFALQVAKYIAALSADVCGKVDAIILTGGIAYNAPLMKRIEDRVSFIAPVVKVPGESELESLAENGYGVLSGKFEIKVYNRERIIEN